MGIRTYFFDTYAFFEIIKGNPRYTGFLEGIGVVTTRLNLMELYYGLLSRHGKDAADFYYDNLVQYAINPTDEIIKKAAEFRAINKGKNLSYVDCIGYVISLVKNIKFLTGDPGFKNLANVEFVE